MKRQNARTPELLASANTAC